MIGGFAEKKRMWGAEMKHNLQKLKEKIEEINDRESSTDGTTDGEAEWVSGIIGEILEELEGFEKDVPFKLDNLAEQIFQAFKSGIPNVTIVRELVQRWADKEILGDSE